LGLVKSTIFKANSNEITSRATNSMVELFKEQRGNLFLKLEVTSFRMQMLTKALQVWKTGGKEGGQKGGG